MSRQTKLGISGIWPAKAALVNGSIVAQPEQWASFYTAVKSHGEQIGIHAPRNSLQATLDGSSKVPGIPAAVVTDLDVPDEELTSYGSLLSDIVTNYSINYLCLGNEIELGSNLAVLATKFNTLYTRIKSANPNVKVCTVFQFERAKTLPDIASRAALFSKADLLCVTSYPNVAFAAQIPGYSKASAIPSNYYSVLSQWSKKPCFTEIAWDTGQADGVNQQSAFLQAFFNTLAPKNTEFANYFTVYDFTIAQPVPFSRMGLCSISETCRPGDNVWLTAVKVPYQS